MQFNERMVAERGAIVRLVQERVLRQTEAAAELGLSTRQVRRLMRRVEAADGDLDALRYQRTHRAPNRLSDELRERVRVMVQAHPRRNAAAIWEAVEGEGMESLPSARTVRRWIDEWRVDRPRATPRATGAPLRGTPAALSCPDGHHERPLAPWRTDRPSHRRPGRLLPRGARRARRGRGLDSQQSRRSAGSRRPLWRDGSPLQR